MSNFSSPFARGLLTLNPCGFLFTISSFYDWAEASDHTQAVENNNIDKTFLQVLRQIFAKISSRVEI